MRGALALLLGAACFAQSVIVYDESGTIQNNRPLTIYRQFKQGDIPQYPRPVINGVSPQTWQTDCKQRWSNDNSAKACHVSFVTTIPGNASVTVAFADDPNPCSSGSRGSCDAASLDEAGMLGFIDGNWDAITSATFADNGSGFTRSASARTCISDGHIKYWMRGPVVTEVICEDNTTARSYDFGATCSGGNCAGDYSGSLWTVDSVDRPLHPIWALRFYAGWQGVRIDYMLADYWTTALKDQRFTLNLHSGPGGNVLQYGPKTFTQYAGTCLHKVMWDGLEPRAINIDYNRHYLQQTGFVMNYDDTSVDSSVAAAEVSHIDNTSNSDLPFDCTTSPSLCAGITKYFPTTGYHAEYGVLPRSYVRWLYTMDYQLYNRILLQADTYGTVPAQRRESRDSGYFYAATPALAHPISLVNRPTYIPNGNGSTSADKVIPVTTLSTAHGWTIDRAHQGSWSYLPYLITGDWYYLQQLYMWAAGNLAGSPISCQAQYGRCEGSGIIMDQERGMANGLKVVLQAAMAAPDADPEQGYFTTYTEHNLEYLEGMLNITDGKYYEACPANYNPSSYKTNYWCFGRVVPNQGKQIPDGAGAFLTYGSGDVRGCDYDGGAGNTGDLDTNVVYTGVAPWMLAFEMNVLQEAVEFGFGADAIISKMGTHFIGKINDSSYPHLLAAYRMPACMAKAGDDITLTAGVTSTDTVFHVSKVPSNLTDNFVMRVDVNPNSEFVRFCGTDPVNLTFTACSATTGVGRGFFAGARLSHASGAYLLWAPRPATWTEYDSGFTSTMRSYATYQQLQSHQNLGYDYVDYTQAVLAGLVNRPGGESAYNWMLANAEQSHYGGSGSIGFYITPRTAEDSGQQPPGASVLPGDLNHDNFVNGLDLQLLVNCVLSHTIDEAADMNSDSKVDVFDVQLLVNIILNGGHS